MAEARVAQHGDEGIDQHQRGQYHEVLRAAAFHVQCACGRALHQVDAVAAAEIAHVVHDEESQLRECQRDHDEVHALGAQTQGAHHQRIQARDTDCGAEHDEKVAAVLAGCLHRRIGTEPEVGRMAQADQPCAAHQDMQAQCKDGQDHDLDDQIGEIGRPEGLCGSQQRCNSQRKHHSYPHAFGANGAALVGNGRCFCIGLIGLRQRRMGGIAHISDP